MKTVYIKDLAIGEGRPKICVPICGKTKEAILEEYKRRQYFVKPSAVKHQKEVSLQHQIDLQNKSNKTKSDK